MVLEEVKLVVNIVACLLSIQRGGRRGTLTVLGI